MKKIFFAIIAIALLAGTAFADDNIEEIPLKKVPDLGLRMVKSYFPSNNVVKAVKNKSKDMKNRTCVMLDNGSTIDFDKDGNWMIVDCRNSSVPMRMVPGKIQMYLSRSHPGADVVYMGREIKNGDITLLLDNGTELHFTNEHTLIP
jgi:hypothetical protein